DTESVREIANRSFGMGWQTRAQIDRRRGWLQSAGAITVDAEGKLVTTEMGLSLLSRLELHPAGAAPAERPEPVGPSAPRPDDRDGPARAEEVARTDELEQRLRMTANLTSSPAEFERAVADAFRSLGYDATHLGGSGQTDVLLAADLGPSDSYHVIIDC